MSIRLKSVSLTASLFTGVLLAACGGSSSGPASAPGATTGVNASPALATLPVTASEAALAFPVGAPQPTGNTATDGLNWFNYRRQLLGEPALTRSAPIDSAAQGHSQYQQLNDTITHDQTTGNPGFTGAVLADRLIAAHYRFTRGSYAYGEVISSTTEQSGVNAAENLITAIYHRFAIFEPEFRQAGAGAAVSASGKTYFTVDLTADGLTPTLGNGNFIVYPANGQQGLPPVFFSDLEFPDPVPNRNQVGYPVSVHADITSTVAIQSFTLNPRGGKALPTLLLQHASDPATPVSAAALIPLDPLVSGETYDVQFSGTVDGVVASRVWSFTTR